MARASPAARRPKPSASARACGAPERGDWRPAESKNGRSKARGQQQQQRAVRSPSPAKRNCPYRETPRLRRMGRLLLARVRRRVRASRTLRARRRHGKKRLKGLKLVVEDSNHEPDKPAETAPAKASKKKRRPMGLKLIVEDSNHEPESPKDSRGGRRRGLSISVDDGNGDPGDGDGRRLSDGRNAAYSEGNYGLSESGAFNAAGFLIKETGIAMAPGRDGSGNSEWVGNGFGRASESKEGGGERHDSRGAGGKSGDAEDDGSGEHMTAQDELLRLCVLGKGPPESSIRQCTSRRCVWLR